MKPQPLVVSYQGARVALFAREFLAHTKGRWRGQPLETEVWQLVEILSPLFERKRDVFWSIPAAAIRRGKLSVREWERLADWVADVEPGSSSRIHNEALIGIPKKNGKSTLFSAIALYLLVGDGEPGAEVYAAAASREQARIVFGQARAMVENSPRLLDFVQVYRNSLYVPSTDSIFRVLAADAPLQEGLNPSGVVIDELHAHRDRSLYDTLVNAIGEHREQPLFVSITTAGSDLKSVCGEMYLAGAGRRPRVVDGRVVPSKSRSKAYFFYWRQVSDDGRRDPREWKKANPASWITVRGLVGESKKPRPPAVFERYRLNRWTRVESYLFPPDAWDRLVDVERCEIAPREPVVVTFDVGQYRDSTALAVVRPALRRLRHDGEQLGEPLEGRGDPANGLVVTEADLMLVYGWVAALHRNPETPEPLAHHIVRGEGPLRLELLKNRILELAKVFRIVAIAGDPYKAESELEFFEDAGFVVIRYDQTNPRMVPASTGLFSAVTEKRLAVPDDPVLAAQLEAAVARDVSGGRGVWRLDKNSAKDPMDFAVALAMAVHLAENDEIVGARRPSVSRVA